MLTQFDKDLVPFFVILIMSAHSECSMLLKLLGQGKRLEIFFSNAQQDFYILSFNLFKPNMLKFQTKLLWFTIENLNQVLFTGFF